MKVNISRSRFCRILNRTYKKGNKNFNAIDIIEKYEFLCKSISDLIRKVTTNELLLLINNNKNASDREMLISLSRFSILIDLKIKEVILEELLKKYIDK